MPSTSASRPATGTPATTPVGAHITIGNGLAAHTFPLARELGAEALQVFAGNPRGWAMTHGDPNQDKEFRDLCYKHAVPAFVHAPYLVNLGSPTEQTYRSSVDMVAHNLARGAQIGAQGVVVHTGSAVAEGNVDSAMKQVREALLPMLDALGADAPDVLLEPTAGQGRSLCAGVDDLRPYLEHLDHHPKVGVCLDTCHVFAAGAPLDEPGGMTRTLDRLTEIAGPHRLRLVHANDSKDARGSFHDRHERVGRGRIGLDAFAEMFAHPALAGVPVLLETPGGVEADREDIPLLKSLRPGPAR
ncbi:MAG: deoxyribonuclease IV [Propionibacteriales bacterium]|nr:deoxyribonuclease IV [Propionibacteriales bacterium]